ncbi:hypothetical protein F2P56_034111 [Juglans regia]|uniref:B3 domain-containing protein REM16-like n=2 Tax=Juglans regia TaxID=51240 RepID=A0A2I4EQD4_JUGRE|nr:B3 domain-containing protein REM16-like [Juglans regia]KAF5445028.1 hypothetical protein F2P56_034111 [Juglans regia]
MTETCIGCSKWAEDMYWTHFQTIHFSQFLHNGYDRQLAIPKKFVDNLKKKLPESVVLKGPSGLTWNVGLTSNDDTLFFNHGWQEFVKDHSLEENDFLIFKYNGGSQFDVLVFDGENLCEKGATYFVRKSEHTEHDNGCLSKRKLGEASIDEVHARCSSPEKVIDDDAVLIPSLQHIISVATNIGTQQNTSPTRSIRARRSLGSKKPATYQEGAVSDSDAELTPINKNGSYRQQYQSNRRSITQDEIKNALHLAQEASSDETFLVVMRPTHVYKRFFVSIPSDWMAKNLSKENQEIILRVENNTWQARYYFHQGRGYGGITGGWKHFAVDNNLEEFDVCLFKPAGHMNYSIILDVSIFRVVHELTPLTQLSSPTPKKRGRKKII